MGVLHLLLGFLESSIQLHIKSYICFCVALAWFTSMEKLAQGSRPIPLCLMLLMDGMGIVVWDVPEGTMVYPMGISSCGAIGRTR